MTKSTDFRNESGLEFIDISSEEWREYTFPGGQIILVTKPLRLHVSEHGHRLFDEEGICHYVPLSWIHLRWKVKDDAPHFVL